MKGIFRWGWGWRSVCLVGFVLFCFFGLGCFFLGIVWEWKKWRSEVKIRNFLWWLCNKQHRCWWQEVHKLFLTRGAEITGDNFYPDSTTSRPDDVLSWRGKARDTWRDANLQTHRTIYEKASLKVTYLWMIYIYTYKYLSIYIYI